METYAIVTWGNPGRHLRTTRNFEKAKQTANACVGRGTCTNARVYRCETAALARTADISEIRKGETCVYTAST